MTIAGVILLIIGRLPVSFRRVIKGHRARLVGLILILPIPIMFMVGFVIGFVYGFNRQSLDPEPFGYFVGVVQLPAILVTLLLAFAIAYWPKMRQSASQTDSELAALYPVQVTPTLTLGQVAFQLRMPEDKVQQLMDDGTLILTKNNGNSEVERVSFDSFMLCRQGVEAANKGQLESALIDFDEAIRLNPKSVRAYFLRGKANLGLGYFAEAYSDFQYVFNSHQRYPQIDDLLVRAREASKTKSARPKWAVKRRSNILVSDIVGGPLFIAVVIIIAMFAILDAIKPITNFANHSCRNSVDCWAPYASDTAIVDRQTQAVYDAIDTATAAPQVAFWNTVNAKRATLFVPTLHAEQTLAPILTATARPFYASATQAVIQLTNADTSTGSITGKLLIENQGGLFLANLNDRSFVEFKVPGLYPNNSSGLDIGSVTWTRSNQRIVFVTNFGVYISNADGTGAKRVIDESNAIDLSDDSDPVLSPDERNFVFQDSRSSDLEIVGVDDAYHLGKARQLVNLPEGQKIDSISWSPNGQSIAYCLRNGANFSMFVVNVDSGITQHLMDPTYVCSLSWSPDGTHIAFITQGNSDQQPRQSSHVTIMDSNGENIRTIFTDFFHTGDIQKPAWSPDGKHLVFGTGAIYSTIFVVDIDGTHLHNVTQNSAYFFYQPQVSWGP